MLNKKILTAVFLIFAVLTAGFFCIQKSRADGNQKILISEVQIGAAAANNEFIELYNPTANDISLTDYKLKRKTASGKEYGLVSDFKATFIPAHGYYLITHPSGYGGDVSADIVYSSASYSIAADNTIILYNRETAVDKVGFGISGDFETVAAVNPEDNKSIARKTANGVMQDTDNNANDFEIKNAAEPQNTSAPKLFPDNATVNPPANATSTEENNNLPPENNSEGQNVLTPPLAIPEQKYNPGDIVINEFVSDPADGEEEWIELYNKTSVIINLSGWYVEEGSGAKTNLSGEITGGGENKFFIVKNISGNLNNKGDKIILRDKQGNLIDQVSYGNWNGGNSGNNAPVADDPASTARKFNGENSFNNKNDFAATFTPTEKKSNIIAEEIEAGDSGAGNYDYSNDIIISEIFPNPKGDDAEKEFVELFNKGLRDVNLSGWTLENGNETDHEIKGTSTIIKAGGYFVVFRKESRLVLNNDGGVVKLYQPIKEKAFETVKYGKGSEGWSFNFIQNKKRQWSEIITPGKANEIKNANHAPLPEFDCPEEILVGALFTFDSSDSCDEDGDKMNFLWDFGDGTISSSTSPEHSFFRSGNYRIKLVASDGKIETKKEKIIKVIGSNAAANPGAIKISADNADKKIIINELLPNPEGADEEGEWIELFNKGTASVNLLNWKLEDGSKKKFVFDSDLFISAGMYYVLERPESGISLNNSNEKIYLYNDFGELADEIEYQKAIEGESLARGAEGKISWTSVLTPGDKNVIKEVKLSMVNLISKSKSSAKKSNGAYAKTSLEKIKDFEAGDLVEVAGTVAVEPGIFGTQYFYIVGSPGIQIYNYKKDFPKLNVGDYIEAKGEISMVNGETRLKTKTADDMKVIEHKGEPAPEAVSGDNLNEDYVGRLVKIAGEIIEKKGTIIYLDDGLGEMAVQIKRNTGVSVADFNEGEAISVTGIVSRSSSGLRILPRGKNDIFSENDDDIKVLGATSEDDNWSLSEQNKNKRLLKYLLVIAGGIIILLAGFFYERFKKN